MFVNLILAHKGIYVPPSNSFPSRFHNMGIRIEASGLLIILNFKNDFD
jgi:hypothetical protein